MASEAQDIPHWSDPRLFRELDFEPQWALLGAKEPEPLPLAAIVERIEAGPGRELWNGQPERPPAALVMRPGSRRPLPIYECPELRTAILAYDEKRLRSVR